MTNKLTDKEKLEISHQNFKDLYDSFIEEKEKWEIKLEQAKLSQKQEDDERFEKMIDELKFVHMVGVKELKARIKGEQKQ